jgi:replication-associated recombination protein RarA
MSIKDDVIEEILEKEHRPSSTQRLNKYKFENLSNAEAIFPTPIFELPMPKNLKPETTCVALINLRFHTNKVKFRIQDTTHVAAMDHEDFLPLTAPIGWSECRREYKQSDGSWGEINKKIKIELLSGIEKILEDLDKIIADHNKSIDPEKFPFLNLSEVEQAIIALMASPNKDGLKGRALLAGLYPGRGEDPTISKIVNALSDRFGEDEVRQALEPDSTLISEDFVLVDVRDLSERNWDKVDLKLNHLKVFPSPNDSSNFSSIQLHEIREPKASLESLELSPDLKAQINGMVSLYKKGKLSSLSLLFFGESGSGKTSLVEAVARELELKVLLVRDYLSSEKNLPSMIHFLMKKYKNKKVLVLFDECENLWYENSFIFENSQSRSKEKNWSKHLLESPNGVVAFTSNFTPPAAFLRRVTLAAELAAPNEEIRAKILVEKCQSLCGKLGINCSLTSGDFKSISQVYDLTGAFLDRAVTLSLVYSEFELTKDSLEKALKSIIATSGKSDLDHRTGDRKLILTEKQTQLIESLNNILERKKLDAQDPLLPKSTSLMLYGPPGTGKTEFAKALSNKLNLKLKMTTASDFLSKYVGESEKNIANVFKQASKNKEILFIDEVEGLFMGRESAQRSWELTQIGEFLKQIESFDGVLVVATNHKELIDQAFSRRFIFQVEFKYPDYQTRIALLNRFVGESLPTEALQEIASTFEFSPGELRNATALWVVAQNQTMDSFKEKLGEQISVRTLTRDRVISIK